MENASKEGFQSDIESRLDDFFGKEDRPQNPPLTRSSLEKIKSLVLSIDWEITDSCLAELAAESAGMLPLVQSDRYSHALLRMLNSLSRYILKRKSTAPPDAIKRLLSVFGSLEQLTGGLNMEEQAKRRIVANEIAAFKKLKAQVEGNRQGYAQAGQSIALEEKNSRVDQLSREVESLKSQLHSMKKELSQLLAK